MMRSTDRTLTKQTMGRMRGRTSTKTAFDDVDGAQLAPQDRSEMPPNALELRPWHAESRVG
jgi:hypothetical protein